MSRWTLAGLFLTVAVSLVAAGAIGQRSSALDEAFQAFWSARTGEEFKGAEARILATKPSIEEVFSRLRAGRPYSGDVPRGRQLLTRKNGDGTEHLHVVHIPEDYDPARRYPIRVYLHGGVMRPKRDDGRWWPNDGGFARPDSIVVFPLSWEGSIWWQTSQIENLAGILNDLKHVYNVDENRAFLLGISDGATGAYYHAFKALTPWAGFLAFNGHPAVLGNPSSDADGEMYVSNLRNRPFFVINGALDRMYPAESVARYIRLFLDAGVYVDFRPQADAGHNMVWWPNESSAIDQFVDTTPRRPLPGRLAWETERPDQFNRAHWLVITELGAVAGESAFDDFNSILPTIPQPRLGISMVGELQNGGGLKLFDVEADSFAELAGLENGDVIVEMNGKRIATVDDFKTAIQGFGPGDEMPVTIDRSGTSIALLFVYPEMPKPEPRQAFPRARPSGRVELERQGNAINAATRGVKRFKLLLSPEQFDFSQPIRVVTNGVVTFEGAVTPSAETLLRWAAVDQDRTLLFGAELDVEVEGK